jgi:hypothetical protein
VALIRRSSQRVVCKLCCTVYLSEACWAEKLPAHEEDAGICRPWWPWWQVTEGIAPTSQHLHPLHPLDNGGGVALQLVAMAQLTSLQGRHIQHPTTAATAKPGVVSGRHQANSSAARAWWSVEFRCCCCRHCVALYAHAYFSLHTQHCPAPGRSEMALPCCSCCCSCCCCCCSPQGLL